PPRWRGRYASGTARASRRATSPSRSRHQPAVLSQVADGMLRPAERLEQARQIVVAVRELRILGKRAEVGLDCGVDTPGVLEQHAEVVQQQCITAAMLE